MKQHFLPRISIILITLLAAFAQTGCKENTLINSKLSPSNNAIVVKDTFLSCITHTFYDDSAVTSTDIGGLSVYQAVGSYTDPFFGTMNGATYFQVVPLDLGYQLLDSAIIDSAILVLPYSGFTFGDTASKTATQTYQVFYMTDSISLNSTYYSFNSVGLNTTFPLSDPYTVNVHSLRDSFGYTVIAANYPGLRIKLKTPYISSLLKTAQSSILSSSATPFADFIRKFNGICVRTADSRQASTAIPYFELDGSSFYSEASILLYYRNPSVSDTEVIEPYFFDKTHCAHFNGISRSYSHSPVNNLYHSTQPNDQVIALQNQPGATIDVIIPGISKLPSGLISKAELQLTLLPGYGNKIQSTTDSQLLVPQKLYPNGIGNGVYPAGINNGLTYILSDYYPLTSTSPLNILDGYLHNLNRGGKVVSTFTIDIPREVMTSIKAKNDTIHLHINGTSDFYGAYQLVAGGGGYPDTLYRPRLFVVYSKLSN